MGAGGGDGTETSGNAVVAGASQVVAPAGPSLTPLSLAKQGQQDLLFRVSFRQLPEALPDQAVIRTYSNDRLWLVSLIEPL